MPIDHYENFPVASLLLPAGLRPAVGVIYQFARSADDLADEGEVPPGDRLAALADYDAALDKIEKNLPADLTLFAALEKVIHSYQLPLQPFRDLLSAFKQDVETTRYATFSQV